VFPAVDCNLPTSASVNRKQCFESERKGRLFHGRTGRFHTGKAVGDSAGDSAIEM